MDILKQHMGHYIDAEKLIAEIDRQEIGCNTDGKHTVEYNTCRKILDIITSLQQEQPEVALEKEIHKFFEECIEVHEVPLYGKVKERVISVDCYEITAYHFYELGLNARKEE